MATVFNMLRSHELIWPYVINNYMRGQPPSAFDLLYWNSDATRMTPANHSFYLRNCYLENRLSKGEMTLDDTRLDLSKVKVPVYNLATREDHIAPAQSVFYGSKFFGGPVRFVLSGSGHIAGVINPPAAEKYQYWTNERDADDRRGMARRAPPSTRAHGGRTGRAGCATSIRRKSPPAPRAPAGWSRSRTRRAAM